MSLKNSANVSVIVPAYNHQNYIGDTIQSVLNQTYKNFELIIINDGSSDETDREIKKFDDPRIKYIARGNLGAHATINEGIKLSKGEYVSILNSDDIYTPDRLEKCLDYLNTNKEYSAVISLVEGIDGAGKSVLGDDKPSVVAWLDWYEKALLSLEKSGMFTNSLAVNVLITTSNYFIKREVFEDLGMFRSLRYAHDWDMLLRIVGRYKLGFIKDTLVNYRIHSENTVHEKESEAKVKFEVNWLVADCLRCLGHDVNYIEITEALKRNHYINYEVLSVLIMCCKQPNPERYLNFDNQVTARLLDQLR